MAMAFSRKKASIQFWKPLFGSRRCSQESLIQKISSRRFKLRYRTEVELGYNDGGALVRNQRQGGDIAGRFHWSS